MSDRKLAILGIVAVLAAGWAILQNRISQSSNIADFSSSPLIEGLQIGSVSGVTITSDKGEKTTPLNRIGESFVLSDKNNYPADVSKINSLINSCLDIRTNEKVTDNSDNHTDLGVSEETAAWRIAFLDNEGKEIVGFFVSGSDEKGAAFVRLLNEKDVYSIQNPPRIAGSPMDYVDAQLLQVQQSQTLSVAVKTGQDTYILKSTEDKSDVELQDMPVGKQFKGTGYKSVFGALSSLRFDDVMSEGSVSEEFKFDSTYACKLDDKTVYKLELAQKDDTAYAKVSADYLDKSPVEKTVGEVESEEELKAKEAKLLAIDAVKAFNQKHEGWVYQIPSQKAGDLVKPLSELLEDMSAPAPEAESEETAKKPMA